SGSSSVAARARPAARRASMRAWLVSTRVRRNSRAHGFSRPGKPTDNAFIESLNGKFRAECLNTKWFLSLHEARRKCEAWRRDYNEVRPHSAIGNQVPAMLHRLAGNPGQAVVR